MTLTVFIVALTLALILAVLGYRNFSLFRLIQELPTLPIQRCRRGLCEIQGTLSSGETFPSPIHHRECLYYALEIEEKTERGFKKLKKIEFRLPFQAADSSGSVLIQSEKAVFKIRSDEQYSSFHFGGQIPEKFQDFLDAQKVRLSPKKEYRFTESFLEPGDAIYLLGFMEENENQRILMGRKGFPFLISDYPENELVRKYAKTALRFFVGALSIAALGAAVFFAF